MSLNCWFSASLSQFCCLVKQLLFNDSRVAVTLQDKYNWDVNDVIPQKLQSSLIYQDVFPGIDLQYTNFGYNIKEQIIINEPQDCPLFSCVMEDRRPLL